MEKVMIKIPEFKYSFFNRYVLAALIFAAMIVAGVFLVEVVSPLLD